jgi:tetratricopeptide (TPR) repeat protein
LKANIDIHQIVLADPSIQSTKIIELLYKKKESLQQLKQLIRPDNYSLLNPLEIEVKSCDLLIEQLLSSDLNIFDPSKLWETFSQALRQKLLFSLTNKMDLDDSPIKNPTELIDATSQGNETFRLMNFEEMQSAIDQIWVKNDPRRIRFLQMMVDNATQEKRDDQAIECLRNALLIPCNDDERAALYNQLAKIYEKQNNWPAALECYENIISMIQLSETSKTLPLAHIGAAKIYGKNQDDHNAIVHYKRGVQLYCQYQSPHHPIVSSYKIVIGLKFKKLGDMDAALKTFQEVIELDHSDNVKVAYKQIGRIYILKDDFDMAYYNLIESLKISQREIPQDIDFIIDIHLLLVCVECQRNHIAEGGVHMEEAIVMSENNECTEATRKDIQKWVKIFSDLQSHNRN